ncbi:MAG: 6-bladed beta-propeller [Paraprevotella sp.]|nr:6-bladed beta-propeller [Paraprevotella sp.]
MKQTLYIVLYASILVACDTSDIPVANTFKYCVSAEDIADSVSFDCIVENFEYIPLETVPEATIGEITNIIVDDEDFFVVTEGVYCFDRNGHFKYKIDQRGHGQSEFVTCNTASVTNHYVHIYDATSKKIMSYDKRNGEYIKTENVDNTPYNIYVNEKCLILDNADFAENSAADRFAVYGRNNNMIEYTCMGEEAYKILIDKQTTMSKSDVLFSDYYSCTTYKITPDSCLAYFRLNVPCSKRYAQNDIDGMIANKTISLKSTSDNGKITGLRNVHETDSTILGECVYDKLPVYITYNKFSNQGLLFKTVISSPAQISPLSIVASDNSYFYSVMPAFEIGLIKSIVGIDELQNDKDINENNRKTLMCIQNDDNPVIVRYKLK